MAIVLGTNAGFVSARPTASPGGASTTTAQGYAAGLKIVAPAGNNALAEIGWYCDNATEAADYIVGIYDHDGANNRPTGAPLAQSAATAKGTGAGWKYASVSYALAAGTTYWIAVQLADTATPTNVQYTDTAGEKLDYKSAASALPSPWGTSDGTQASLLGIYGLSSAIRVVYHPGDSVYVPADDVRLYAVWTEGGDAAITGGTIASAEAHGSARISASVSGGTVSSAESIGQPAVSTSTAAATIDGGTIASSEAFGSATVGATVSGGTIASGESVGSATAKAAISGGTTSSAEAQGQPAIASVVTGGTISTEEAIGSPQARLAVTGGTISGAESLGPLSLAASLALSSMPGAESMGQPAVGGSPAAVTGAGAMASGETFGQPAMLAALVLSGIASGETFGIPAVGGTAPANIVALGMMEKKFNYHMKFFKWLWIGLIGGLLPTLVAQVWLTIFFR